MQIIKEFIRDIFKGGIVGIANIIPGVSGGTMLLILGIYERLISAIHNISPATIGIIFGVFRFNKESFDDFKAELERIDFYFLLKILVGALVAVVALASAMRYLLKELHDPTFGFFFGLVLVSIIAPYKMIKKITIACVIAALLACGTVGFLAELSGSAQLKKEQIKCELEQSKTAAAAQAGGKAAPVEGKRGSGSSGKFLFYAYIFLLGAISISAMILPGVSGSLLMLLMGGYFDVLQALTERDFLFIGVFGLGCLTGIALFSRLLNFLLERWHDITMSALLGLVLGSLWAIWPFKTFTTICDKRVDLSNTLPGGFDTSELYTVLAALVGIVLVGLLIWVESRNNKEPAA
ncbi:MAG: DUF368 domain-containing protein [bacterium]|nr:DUF368 domain-containing protein [bacterium]